LKVIDLVGTFITEHFLKNFGLIFVPFGLDKFFKAKEVAFYRFFCNIFMQYFVKITFLYFSYA